MPKLDVVKAAFAGFGVIGRNPLAVLVWAVFIFVVGFLPVLLLFGGVATSIAHLATLEAAGTEATPETVMPLVGSILALVPILMLSGLVLRTVLTGAIYRAVLFPEDKAWFYLRLGARELWLALLIVVFGVLVFVAYIVLSMLTFPLMLLAGLGGAGMNPDDPAAAAAFSLMILPVYFIMMAAMVFLFVRFGMAFPMTFAQSQFRLFESWTFTRGNSWRLVLVILLLIAMLVGLEILAWMLIMLGVVAVFGAGAAGGWDEASMEAFFRQEPAVWMGALAPWIVAGVALACILGAIITVVFTAPWADAYRQLSAKPETPQPDAAA